MKTSYAPYSRVARRRPVALIAAYRNVIVVIERLHLARRLRFHFHRSRIRLFYEYGLAALSSRFERANRLDLILIFHY